MFEVDLALWAARDQPRTLFIWPTDYIHHRITCIGRQITLAVENAFGRKIALFRTRKDFLSFTQPINRCRHEDVNAFNTTKRAESAVHVVSVSSILRPSPSRATLPARGRTWPAEPTSSLRCWGFARRFGWSVACIL